MAGNQKGGGGMIENKSTNMTKYHTEFKNNIPILLQAIASRYKLKVSRDLVNCAKDSSASSGDEIWIGEYSNESLEIISFFHEVGHCISNRMCKRGRHFTILSAEGVARVS